MRIALVNELSKATLGQVLTPTDLEDIANVLSKQMVHYADFHQAQPVAIAAFETLRDVPHDACLLAFFWDSDQAGALGYHDVSPNGRPYGKVFLGPTLENGGSLSKGPDSVTVTASHEALEMRGDAYANLWADRNGYEVAYELCDLVEADSYDIDGMSVSNFLGPRAFEQWDKISPGDQLDYMGTLKHGTYSVPRANCYEIRRGITGTSYPVFGRNYPEWRKVLKSHPASRTAARLGLHRPHDLTIIGEDVPVEATADLKRMARYARGLGITGIAAPHFEEPPPPPAAPAPYKPLFDGNPLSLVGRRR